MDKLIEKIKDKGLKLVEKTKKQIKKTILDDQLRRRFQLENPRRFIVSNHEPNMNLINEIISANAKVYEEDQVFVFYGHGNEDLSIGNYVKDLGNLQLYKIKSVVQVEIPVTLKDQVHDVPGTAVYCEEV